MATNWNWSLGHRSPAKKRCCERFCPAEGENRKDSTGSFFCLKTREDQGFFMIDLKSYCYDGLKYWMRS
jgi:hypothetical protein